MISSEVLYGDDGGDDDLGLQEGRPYCTSAVRGQANTIWKISNVGK